MAVDFYVYKVSVVVPTYNSEKTIGACMESLLNQSYEPFEIIVVDSFSTDRTKSIVDSFIERAPEKIIALSIQRRSSYAARNKGIEVSEGEIIAFTDSDCIAHRDWLRNMVMTFRSPKVGEVGGKIYSAEPQTIIQRFCELVGVLDQEYSMSSKKKFAPSFVLTTNCAVTKKVLGEVRGFDEEFISAGDLDLTLRIRSAGYEITYQPEAIIYHIHRDTIRALWQQNSKNGYGISSWRRKKGKKYHVDIWLYADTMYWLSFKLVEYWLKGISAKDDRYLYFITPFLEVFENIAKLYGKLKYSLEKGVIFL